MASFLDIIGDGVSRSMQSKQTVPSVARNQQKDGALHREQLLFEGRSDGHVVAGRYSLRSSV
eukprot:scaffold549355_cov20-Prasinocladus_malaysianus.AAC.1